MSPIFGKNMANRTSARRLIFVGRPGSGKGTQAKLIAEAYDIPHISTGDIFRDEMARKTSLGLQITDSMNKGLYTSDEITNAVVKNRLSQPDVANGFILDGYPRTLNQVLFLAEENITIDAVINFEILEEDAVARIMKRAQEQNRKDDTLEIIQGRMATYLATVVPVIDSYQRSGILWDVNAGLSIDKLRITISSIVN